MADTNTITKFCCKCGEHKPIAEFSKNRGNKDGLQTYCRPCHRASVLKWQKDHPQKANEKNRKWQAANPDKKKEYAKKSRENNKEALRIAVRNRRAKQRGLLSKGLIGRLLRMQRGKCACCGKPLGTEYHIDHIIPLALGGENTDCNIQLLRAECNLQKGAKHPVDFMQQRGFLL